MIRRFAPALLLPLLLAIASPAHAQRAGAPAAGSARQAYVDSAGVVRWRGTDEEVRLFGANYAIASSSDYRAAGYVSTDRKRMIDEDVAHFARMGWNGMRLAFWGDWQNADRQGNLIPNDHLDLLDYLVAKARERGISILFNPIHTYHAGWPDAMGDSFPGFSAHTPKERLGTDSAAMAAQVSYLRQILAHVNPYTGVALRDEPAIVFIEMINEPIHHPEDVAGSVRYIDALVDAVRGAGSGAITFHNVSQDFRIAESIRRSRVQGATFGWYPTGLNAGRELRGNTLRTVDAYPAFGMPELRGRPRLVYEFDSADQLTGYMYPAMVREFRAGGVQLAAMFAYDMLETASRNLGWQTHRLNLVYTPRKAMSAVIAAEAMRRLPRGVSYGGYPGNTRFGPFRVSYEENRSEMAADDALLYAGSTRTAPPAPGRLERIAGYGSSPVVEYDGEGVYFLDRVRPGVWRLEVYPDAVDVEDPFRMQRGDKVVTRAIYCEHLMRVTLPALGAAFHVRGVAGGDSTTRRAADGRFTVRPGVYVLSAAPVDLATMPARIANVGFTEFHAPRPDPLPARVVPLDVAPERVAGAATTIAARVVTDTPPDSVTLWLRRVGTGWFRPFPMRPESAYGYRAALPADALADGVYDYVISVAQGDSVVTFPEGVRRLPSSWDFSTTAAWRFTAVLARAPLRLLRPGDDAPRLAFSRIGDGYREGIFRIVASPATAEPALHFELPVAADGITPQDYTTSLEVLERIAGRGASVAAATGVRIRLRGVGTSQRLHVTLMERDGTPWTAAVTVDSTWTDVRVPLRDFHAGRAAMLPQGYPGTWNYWVGPAAGRGTPADAIRLPDIERLQLSLRPEPGTTPRPHTVGVEVEGVWLTFD
ncbi:MAG TPA: hypothetical protein VFH27_01180 [Longimicrobiaceae bacterium]|nr:hypothetical protein [Longimicrobiaceae bacterium]